METWFVSRGRDNMPDGFPNAEDSIAWRSYVATTLALVQQNLDHFSKDCSAGVVEVKRDVQVLRERLTNGINLRVANAEQALQQLEKWIGQVNKDLAMQIAEEKQRREKTMDRVGKWISSVTASLFVAMIVAMLGSYWALSSTKSTKVSALEQEVEQLSKQVKGMKSPAMFPFPNP